ncbi:MAG: hypothetical protein ABIE42_05725 [Candidatus Eisenbacteria bacterium]
MNHDCDYFNRYGSFDTYGFFDNERHDVFRELADKDIDRTNLSAPNKLCEGEEMTARLWYARCSEPLVPVVRHHIANAWAEFTVYGKLVANGPLLRIVHSPCSFPAMELTARHDLNLRVVCKKATPGLHEYLVRQHARPGEAALLLAQAATFLKAGVTDDETRGPLAGFRSLDIPPLRIWVHIEGSGSTAATK